MAELNRFHKTLKTSPNTRKTQNIKKLKIPPDRAYIQPATKLAVSSDLTKPTEPTKPTKPAQPTKSTKPQNQQNPKTPKNARNLVIFWTTGKGKYTILLEISCQ